jgi:hypothetical protein
MRTRKPLLLSAGVLLSGTSPACSPPNLGHGPASRPASGKRRCKRRAGLVQPGADARLRRPDRRQRQGQPELPQHRRPRHPGTRPRPERDLPVTASTPGQQSSDQFFQGMGFTSSGQLVVGSFDRSYGTDETTGFSDISVGTSSDLATFRNQRVTSSSMPGPRATRPGCAPARRRTPRSPTTRPSTPAPCRCPDSWAGIENPVAGRRGGRPQGSVGGG